MGVGSIGSPAKGFNDARELHMFRGKADLIGPETGKSIGTFTERGEHGGKAETHVHLSSPITLTGTARLQIFSSIKDEAVLTVDTNGAAERVIHEFGGESALGLLPDQEAISLVRSPGGDLGSLLEVLGQGTIHREHH